MNFFKRKTHELRPKPRTLYGIEVKKQPTLAYIEAMKRMGGLALELVEEAFPSMTPGEVVTYLTTLTTEQFKEISGRLLSVLPEKALAIMREIVGAQDNPAWETLTPYEHSEIIKAFWELNDLSAFFMNARSVMRQMVQQAPNTGLNG